VLAAIDEGDSTEQRLSQEAVSLALMISGHTAQAQLKTAASLVTDLPATMALLQKGKISGRHAEAISQTSWKLPIEPLAALEARVADRAAEQTVPIGRSGCTAWVTAWRSCQCCSTPRWGRRSTPG
jgi:hypothetical protein